MQFAQLKRREFITLVGGVAAWPFFARGQEAGRIYRLGVLLPSPRDAPHYVALFDELRRLGFIGGGNLMVDAAGFGLPPERMEVHAADLMNGRVDVILAAGDVAVRAAQRATTSIPILAFTDDMVGQGFVNSLSKPGGNITGLQSFHRNLTANGSKSLSRRFLGFAGLPRSWIQHHDAVTVAYVGRRGSRAQRRTFDPSS
jgi:putative ABC transport system substrate-binding protein